MRMSWREPKPPPNSHGVYLSNEGGFGENDHVEAELQASQSETPKIPSEKEFCSIKR